MGSLVIIRKSRESLSHLGITAGPSLLLSVLSIIGLIFTHEGLFDLKPRASKHVYIGRRLTTSCFRVVVGISPRNGFNPRPRSVKTSAERQFFTHLKGRSNWSAEDRRCSVTGLFVSHTPFICIPEAELRNAVNFRTLFYSRTLMVSTGITSTI